MKRSYFLSKEKLGSQDSLPLDEVIENLAFNEQGLIPVITQDARTKQVLMMAWMNREALTRTLNSGRMTYWSRSRQEYWVKGETSGNTQALVQLSFDCDGDAVLCLVESAGPACHTGREHCFYLNVNADGQTVSLTDLT